ncbi:AAA family ATPase [Streptomyces sp. NL15-2K]|uniref:AAA family ATPase n=1 Tax=Streptomyces sp. NL15-2K TaxID=376149 RepID=UPI000F5846E9|nr:MULTISPECIES: AAA family ATPase [Actinomycetes]WKX10935.1 AAA family ATPase [Kutzneria buriramensis]
MRDTTRAEVRDIAGAIASETVMRYADALARSPYAEQTMETTAQRVATEVARSIADERVAHAEEIVRAAEAAAGNTATETAQRVAEKTAASLTAEATAKSLEEAREAVAEALAESRRAVEEALEKARAEAKQALERAQGEAKEELGKARAEAKDELGKARAEAKEELGKARTEAKEALGQAQREVKEEFGEARTELEEAQGELKKALSKIRVDLAEAQGNMDKTLSKAWTALVAARDQVTETVGQFARDEAVRAVLETVAEKVPPVVEVRVADADPVRVTGHTHAVLPDVLLALGAGCHVLLVGPAGTGKSMMAQQAAEAFSQEFHALSLGPTTPMSKIFGYYDAHGTYHGTPFRSAFEHGGLMLLDELDSGHPGLLAELNQALSIRSCAFADGMVAAHPQFRLIATANTYGTGGDRQYVGRQALDAATLDRFVVIDVPVDEDLEERLALAHAPARQEDTLRVIEKVRRLRATAAEKRLPVMFSPRAGIDAAKLLQAGASVEQAIRWRVVRGMSAAHRSALGLGEGGEDGGQ